MIKGGRMDGGFDVQSMPFIPLGVNLKGVVLRIAG